MKRRKILLKEYFSKNIDDSSIKMNNEYRSLRKKLMNHIDSIPELDGHGGYSRA